METLAQWGAISGVMFTGVIFALVGLLLFVIGWFQGHGARAAANWNTAEGEVLESTVEQYRYSDSEGGMNTGYRPRITYGFRVGGRDYVGERLNFGSAVNSSIKSLAESKSKKFPTGSKVHVYYNPNDPNDAALEKSAPASRLLYVIGAIMLVVGLFVCVGGGMFSAMFV